MEIINEIKAKVFAQYLGQKAQSDVAMCPIGILTFVVLPTQRIGILEKETNHEQHIKGCKLILKPLSAITNEDAIEVANLVKYNVETTKALLKKYGSDCVFITMARPFQFLQSRGYDMPQFLLNGKTLQEAGLAIYEYPHT